MPEAMDSVPRARGTHTISMEGRSRLTVTDVSDVPSFCEQTVVMDTGEGRLTIIGEELHISRLHLGEGVVQVDGKISAMEYGEKAALKGKSVIHRLLR